MANILIQNSKSGYVSFVVKGRNKNKDSESYGKVQTISTITGIREMSKAEYLTFKEWVMQGSADMRVAKVMNHPYVLEHIAKQKEREEAKEEAKEEETIAASEKVKKVKKVKKVYKSSIADTKERAEQSTKERKELEKRKEKKEKHEAYLHELKHKYDDVGVRFIGNPSIKEKVLRINNVIESCIYHIEESQKKIHHINKKIMLGYTQKEKQQITDMHNSNIKKLRSIMDKVATQKANLRR